MDKKYEKYVLAVVALTMGMVQPSNAKFDLKEVSRDKSLIAHGDQPGNCAGHTKSIAEEQAKYESQQKKKKKKKKAADTDSSYSYRVDEDNEVDSDESEE